MIKLKGFNLGTKLILDFKQIKFVDETTYSTFYSSLKAEKIINENNIDDVFESIYSTVISNIQKTLRKELGWITDSVVYHAVNISKNKPFHGSSYMELLK